MLHMQREEGRTTCGRRACLSVEVQYPRQLNIKHMGKDLLYITICACVSCMLLTRDRGKCALFLHVILTTVPLTGRGGATQLRGLLTACTRVGKRKDSRHM